MPPTSSRPSFCDICWRSRDGHGMKLLKCRDCGVVVHDVCYGLDPAAVPPNFQCLACAAVGTTVKVRERDPQTGERLQFTIKERPTECCLCTVDHEQVHPHAMHPVYDNYGTAARQMVMRATKTKPARLAWVHSLCGFSVNVITSGCVYACTRDGYYGEGEDDEESYISMEDDSINSDLKPEEGNPDESSIHHFGYVHSKPRDRDNIHLRSMKERQTDLKCIFCGQKDDAGVYRLAVQCNANDPQEYEGFQGCHETLGNSTCLQAMHVGCAAWGLDDEGSPPNIRRVFYFPGTDEEGQYGETVVNLFCPIHAQDLILHEKYNKRVYQYHPNGVVAVRKVGQVSPHPAKKAQRVLAAKPLIPNQIGFIPPSAGEAAAIERGLYTEDVASRETKKTIQKRRNSAASQGPTVVGESTGSKPPKLLRTSSIDISDHARKNVGAMSSMSSNRAGTEFERSVMASRKKAGKDRPISKTGKYKQKAPQNLGGVLVSILQGNASNTNDLEVGPNVEKRQSKQSKPTHSRKKLTNRQNLRGRKSLQEQLQAKEKQTEGHQSAGGTFQERDSLRNRTVELPSPILEVEIVGVAGKHDGSVGKGRLMNSTHREIQKSKQDKQVVSDGVCESNKQSPSKGKALFRSNAPKEVTRLQKQVNDLYIVPRRNVGSESERSEQDAAQEISRNTNAKSHILPPHTTVAESSKPAAIHDHGTVCSRPPRARKACKISESKIQAIEAQKLETAFHEIVNDIYDQTEKNTGLTITEVLRLRKEHWQKEWKASGIKFSPVWEKVEQSIGISDGKHKADLTTDKKSKTSVHHTTDDDTVSSTIESHDSPLDEASGVRNSSANLDEQDKPMDSLKEVAPKATPMDWSFLFVGKSYNQAAIRFSWKTIEEKRIE